MKFSRVSGDGEGGYPGEVTATVTYELAPLEGGLGALTVTMEAVPSAAVAKATPVNLVHHTHWNLAGREAVAKVCYPCRVSVATHTGIWQAVRQSHTCAISAIDCCGFVMP